MKYKVIKEFGCARVGDELVNSTLDPQVFTMEVVEDDSYRAMSLDNVTADVYCEHDFLVLVEEPTDAQRIDSTLELINKLLEQYNKDYRDISEAADNGEVQPCVRVESETVFYNLTKVLTAIKEELTRDE